MRVAWQERWRVGLPLRRPGHTPRTRFACARPFRFTKGGVGSPPFCPRLTLALSNRGTGNLGNLAGSRW